MSSNSLLDPPKKRNLGAGTRLEPLRPKQGASSRTASSSAGPRPNYASSTGALRARVMGSAGTTQPASTTSLRHGTGGERRPSSADTGAAASAAATRAGSVGRKLPANARHAGTTPATKSQPRAPASRRPHLSAAAGSTGGSHGTQPHANTSSGGGGEARSPSHAGKERRRSSSSAHPPTSTVATQPNAGSAFFTAAGTAKRRGSATTTTPTAAHGTAHGSAVKSTNTSMRPTGEAAVPPSAHEARRRVSGATRVVPSSADGGTRAAEAGRAGPHQAGMQVGTASPLQATAAAARRQRSQSVGSHGPSASVRVGGALPAAAYDGTVRFCTQQKFWKTGLPETVRDVLDGNALESPFLTHLWKQAYDNPSTVTEEDDTYVDYYAFESDAEYRSAVDAQRRQGLRMSATGVATSSATALNNGGAGAADAQVNPNIHSCPTKIAGGFYACVRCHLPIVSPLYQIVNTKERGIAAFSHLNAKAVDVQLSPEALVRAVDRVAVRGSDGSGHGTQRRSFLASSPADGTAGSGTATGLIFLVKCRACGGCLGALSQEVPPAMVHTATGGEVFYANSCCLEYLAVEVPGVAFNGTISGELEAADARAEQHHLFASPGDNMDDADALDAISRDVDAWFDDDIDSVQPLSSAEEDEYEEG